MKHHNYTLATAVLATLTSVSAVAGDCKFTRQLEQSIAADDAQTVYVVARAGQLEVTGHSGDQVRVTGTACASSEALLDQIAIDLSADDQDIKAAAELPEIKSSWGSRYAYLHMEVEVPVRVALNVKDSSGSMLLEGVGSADVQDSSGDIEIVDVKGNLRVRDSSGGISIRDVSGDVSVVDSSGEIEIESVVGVATIESDSSGSIDIQDVSADVIIHNDSSGDIEIGKVGGLVQIDRDSGGAIRVNDVEGDVTVGYDSGGNIEAKRVRGDFVVERDSSGRINYSDIQGKVVTPGRD